MEKTNPKVICKNIFKSGDIENLKATFTRMWIELINQFEKNKNTTTKT
ncbi:hypothetical protein SOV_50470 [Sporomusa ovata DSM 2662]|uniref:Uncharacterized protein n=1 Tax=Sporomusa ovata TaxID=2378 RepID=A0A0U1L0S0_9FIRM|nr:hypothetical protein SOV_2c03160 [Sporomusa ovata DSM 2662]CQR73266.1 hypothetical protein SpAn4DRAFT_2498 [Sporomusa ovata]